MLKLKSLLAAMALLGQVPAGQKLSALEDQEKKEKEKAEEKEPPLERLLQLNARELFGAEASVSGNHVVLSFPDNGAFGRAFLSRGAAGKGFLSDAKEFNTVTVKDMIKESEGKISFVGAQTGSAASKFQLAGDFKVSFKIKMPNVGRSSQLSLRFNQQDPKNFIQTNFFQDITLVGHGRQRQALTQEKLLAGPPTSWFDKTSKGVPVEIVYKEKKLTITMHMKKEKKKEPEKMEVVSMDGVGEPASGRLLWTFNQLSFVVTDLVIEGTISEGWAKEEIARLREKGQLLLKEPEVVASADANKEKKGEAEGGAKGEGGAPADARKKGGVNIDEPDPEAEEDL